MRPEQGAFQLLVFYFLKNLFTTGNICSDIGEPLKCCPNYKEVNGTCSECPDGSFGHNCEHLCDTNYYGRFCGSFCNCSQLQGYYCHHTYGCTKIVTEESDMDRGTESDRGAINNAWPWVLLAFILILCGIGIAAATVIAQKHGYCPGKSQNEKRKGAITPYSIQVLSCDADQKFEETQYAAIVRSGTKANYNKDQDATGRQSNSNIYSTGVLSNPRYDLLQFHPKPETILRSTEEDHYDFTVQT